MIGSERVSESNITKKVLAKALKNCMQTKSFAKITVMDICEECGMNRKTFYYHFKDKFDLVNWIFNIECLKQLHHSEYVFLWKILKRCVNTSMKIRIFIGRYFLMMAKIPLPSIFKRFFMPCWQKIFVLFFPA